MSRWSGDETEQVEHPSAKVRSPIPFFLLLLLPLSLASVAPWYLCLFFAPTSQCLSFPILTSVFLLNSYYLFSTGMSFFLGTMLAVPVPVTGRWSSTIYFLKVMLNPQNVLGSKSQFLTLVTCNFRRRHETSKWRIDLHVGINYFMSTSMK